MLVSRRELSDNGEAVLAQSIKALKEIVKGYENTSGDDVEAAMRIIASKKIKK